MDNGLAANGKIDKDQALVKPFVRRSQSATRR
jgi:hypothetical protein